MAVEIKIPNVGESISEVVVSQWLKADGEFVEKDEPIVELETDKVNQELTAPESGVLKVAAAEGDTVEIGAVIGTIAPGEAGAAPAKNTGAEKAAEEKGGPAKAEEPAAPKTAPPTGADGEAKGDVARATPVARKVAEEYHISLADVKGSGPGGRITKEDVMAKAQGPKETAPKAGAPAPAKPAAPTGDRAETRERMSTLRKRIAARLVEAQQTAAMLTTFNEVDMTNVMAVRSRYKEDFQKRHGVGLGFMSFFAKACVEALREFPRVNAFIENDEIVYHHYYDIGVAVGTEKGLVVPVVRNVEKMSFAQIESAIREFAVRARDGKLALEDLTGGTFTISNGGVYGSMMSTPILNPPQSGILGMHNILKRPVAIGEGVEIRPMMYLALSYDHRIVDGKEAVGFLVKVKDCIEAPERMLLDV